MGNYISGNESQYLDLYSVHLSMSYLIDRCIVRFKLLDIHAILPVNPLL